MKVGVPRETWPGEHRVALIPSAAAALKKTGLDVVVEQDAGLAAGFPSAAYEQGGATVASRDRVFSTADIILQVRSVPPEQGRLRISGRTASQAHAPVRIGDVLSFALRGKVRVIRVERLPSRRGPPAEAQLLYSDVSEGPLTSEAQAD